MDGWFRRISGRVAAAAVAGVVLVPVALPLALAQPAAAQANGCGNGNGNGNGGNPHCTTTTQNGSTTTAPHTTTSHGNPHNTTTTTCSYPFNNCTTTTTSAGPQPIIIIDVTVAVPGQTIEVTICAYAPGAVVRITFNGVVVLQIVVPNGNPATCTVHNVALGGPVLAAIGPLGHAVVQAQTSDHTSGATGQFQVPPDTHSGSYLVCAESPGMSTPCTKLNVASGSSVLGTSFSRGSPFVSASDPNSFLAFSGMGLVRLIALALALVGIGWFLMRRGDHRPRSQS